MSTTGFGDWCHIRHWRPYGSLGLYVSNIPQNLVKALPEVGGGRVLSVGRRWDSSAELNSWLWPAEATTASQKTACLREPGDSARMPEGARPAHRSLPRWLLLFLWKLFVQ
ncbi:hypothetical protein ILYODFUR_009058 [Ilyodon furcidens]|uniref:Uncharacterized protein n=1 Tax=Ilyodon furcidens TaxID=33524 RepID=A0ABV0TK22_9TELE